MSVRITAIICTFNRALYLREAIRSLVHQTLPPEQYEILVVDNASTDSTRLVVQGEFRHVAHLRYLYEAVPGLSRARNTGWRQAQGEYVAYLDDDAVAASRWLERILEVFGTVQPRPGMVGGKIEPLWGIPRPPWLSDRIARILAVLDWSPVPIQLEPRQWLAGANMAFPKSLLEEVGGFQTGLGRKGEQLLSNEEVLLWQQLERRGYRRFYHPEASVQHHIPASRLTQGWFIRRYYWEGVSQVRMEMQSEFPPFLKRLRMTLSLTKRFLWSPRQWASLMMPTDHPRRFEQKCLAWTQIGHLGGVWSGAR